LLHGEGHCHKQGKHEVSGWKNDGVRERLKLEAKKKVVKVWSLTTSPTL